MASAKWDAASGFDALRKYAVVRRLRRSAVASARSAGLGGRSSDCAAVLRRSRREDRVAREAAYAAADGAVRVASRCAFRRSTMVEDLEQAARLKIFTHLPKLAEICDCRRFYERLAISMARRAMCGEYERLRRQAAGEVPMPALVAVEQRPIGGLLDVAQESWAGSSDARVDVGTPHQPGLLLTKPYGRAVARVAEAARVPVRAAALAVQSAWGREPSPRLLANAYGLRGERAQAMVNYSAIMARHEVLR